MSLFELRETYNYGEYLMQVGTVTPEMLEQLPQLIDIRQAERDAIREAQAAALAMYQAMGPAFIADIAHDIAQAAAADPELAYWQINPNVRLTTVLYPWVINTSNELILADMRQEAITDHLVFWGYARGIMRNGWFVGQDWSVWSSWEEWVQITEVALAGGEIVSINRVVDIYQEHVTLTDGTIWRLRDSPLAGHHVPLASEGWSEVSIALRSDGTLWAWGLNFIPWGQGVDPNAGLRPELFMSGIMVP